MGEKIYMKAGGGGGRGAQGKKRCCLYLWGKRDHVYLFLVIALFLKRLGRFSILDALPQARELEKTAAAKGVEIILPSDVVVADAFAADANTQVRKCKTHLVKTNTIGAGVGVNDDGNW